MSCAGYDLTSRSYLLHMLLRIGPQFGKKRVPACALACAPKGLSFCIAHKRLRGAVRTCALSAPEGLRSKELIEAAYGELSFFACIENVRCSLFFVYLDVSNELPGNDGGFPGHCSVDTVELSGYVWEEPGHYGNTHWTFLGSVAASWALLCWYGLKEQRYPFSCRCLIQERFF